MPDYKILFFTSLFPNNLSMVHGNFNLMRAKSLANAGCRVKVIAPVGLTPPQKYMSPVIQLYKIMEHIREQRKIKIKERYDSIEVFHPRWWWFPKKYFWPYEAELLHFFIDRKVNEVIKQFNPDLILSSWLNPFGTYCRYFKKYRIPIFLIAEGSDILIYPKKYKGIERIKDSIQKNIDSIIYVSAHLEKEAAKYFPFTESIIIRNGYNSKIFKYTGNRQPCKDVLRLITIGNHTNVKGYDLLLEALKKLRGKWHLTMCGSGELTEVYKQFAEKNALMKNISFLNTVSQEEIQSLLNISDICCQPSRSEGFPSAPLEAMACGVPVIASDAGGLPEIIKNGFNGYIFRKESVDDLFEAIIKAKKTNWNRLEISEWVKAYYSWDKWAQIFLKFYTDKFILSPSTREAKYSKMYV